MTLKGSQAQHYVNGIPVEEASSLGFGVPYETPEERADARADWLKQAAAPDVQAHQALILAGFYSWAKGLETPADVGNGLVTANEFASLDLCGTDLVVLSACGTGLGKLVSTESSVAGFRRTAFIAGARSVVTSLWRVPDRPTTELMIRFYAHLAKGSDSASSLRIACLDVRKRYPHPKNWAGFICEGAASSLELG